MYIAAVYAKEDSRRSTLVISFKSVFLIACMADLTNPYEFGKLQGKG